MVFGEGASGETRLCNRLAGLDFSRLRKKNFGGQMKQDNPVQFPLEHILTTQ